MNPSSLIRLQLSSTANTQINCLHDQDVTGRRCHSGGKVDRKIIAALKSGECLSGQTPCDNCTKDTTAREAKAIAADNRQFRAAPHANRYSDQASQQTSCTETAQFLDR